MPHKHKKIIEITELPEDSSPITDVSAIEKSSPAPTAKLTNTWVLPVIATLILIVSGIAAGFGYYIVTSRNTLNSQKQELINIKEQALQESKAKEEAAQKARKAEDENIQLKQDAAKKAAEEAAAVIKKAEEDAKNSKKYVVSDKKETNLPGLNTRKTPCGEIAGQLRVWGTGGEVVEGPTKPGPCLGGDFEWYKVKWNDGVEGWSIADYLNFSAQRQVSQTGYITGYTPIGYSLNNDPILPTICATNTADNISYCNAQVDKDKYFYKLVVPAGEYVMSGNVKYKNWESGQLQDYKLIFSVSAQCGYTIDCYNRLGQDGYKKNAIFKVDVGGIATNVNMSQIY